MFVGYLTTLYQPEWSLGATREDGHEPCTSK